MGPDLGPWPRGALGDRGSLGAGLRAHRQAAYGRAHGLRHQLGRSGRATEHGLRELGSATHLRARGRLVHHAPVAAPGPDHRHRLPAGGAFPAVARRAQRGGAAAPGYVAADHRSRLRPPHRDVYGRRGRAARSDLAPGLAYPPRGRGSAGLAAVGGDGPGRDLARQAPMDAPARRRAAPLARGGADGRRRATRGGRGRVDPRPQRDHPRPGLLPARPHLPLVQRRGGIAGRRAGAGPAGRPHPRLLVRGQRGQPQGNPGPAGPAQAGGAGAGPDRGAQGRARRSAFLRRRQPETRGSRSCAATTWTT